MTLAKEGKASSIGIATLQYESWQLLPDGQLILNGKSIGNGQTISFSDTLAILSLQQDTLTLRKGADYQIKYVRQPESASLYAKIKNFRAQFRGVKDKAFFLYRLTKIYA